LPGFFEGRPALLRFLPASRTYMHNTAQQRPRQ
jgi:hypothetical protein